MNKIGSTTVWDSVLYTNIRHPRKMIVRRQKQQHQQKKTKQLFKSINNLYKYNKRSFIRTDTRTERGQFWIKQAECEE